MIQFLWSNRRIPALSKWKSIYSGLSKSLLSSIECCASFCESRSFLVFRYLQRLDPESRPEHNSSAERHDIAFSENPVVETWGIGIECGAKGSGCEQHQHSSCRRTQTQIKSFVTEQVAQYGASDAEKSCFDIDGRRLVKRRKCRCLQSKYNCN